VGIDKIVKHVLIKPNLGEAVAAMQDIEYDAFMVLVTHLHDHYPEECFAYLSAVVCQHHEPDVRFNAAQFLFDNYEISPSDQIRFATRLDPEALAELFGSETAGFVENELLCNSSSYGMHESIDELSSATRLESVDVCDLAFRAAEDERIEFSVHMYVEVTLVYDGEEMGSQSFPGSFSGFFDEHGMHVERASVDTKAF
jgi:hypothetical protein